MSLLVVTSPRFGDHVTPPGHPERVERAETMEVVASKWRDRGGAVMDPHAATDDDLLRVHDADYLQTIVDTRGRTAMLDPDTFTSPQSEEVARLAAGAVLTGIDHVLDGQSGRRAFVMARPPGHHAEHDRAMGFCLYNSIAVGAAYARAGGLSRIAVVDYDVHHGNGTQSMFYDDPSVLVVSSHQFPFYPGTGATTEIGRGEGLGKTVNLPLEAGAGDADYDLIYREVAVLLEEFRPELLLVSAGFDAHERDPLGGMRVTADGFGGITARLLQAADAVCEGRTVFVTEGGYDAHALAQCCQRVIDLASLDLVASPLPPRGDTRRSTATLQAARAAHGGHWRTFGTPDRR
jgi:acetoin utilization deacetylase AcuC-like enzyme